MRCRADYMGCDNADLHHLRPHCHHRRRGNALILCPFAKNPFPAGTYVPASFVHIPPDVHKKIAVFAKSRLTARKLFAIMISKRAKAGLPPARSTGER